MAEFLLTGATGQVGSELRPMLSLLGEVAAPGRNELDLNDLDAVRRYVRVVRPRWIVNAAAYTAVDKAESEPEAAYRLNGELPGILGEEASMLGASVIHYSTDYVFSGAGTRPYIETDATGPLNVYGQSKLSGELALEATGASHSIFRTSWVYSAVGTNFVRTILRYAREREELGIVADQYGAPTWARDLARLAAHTITFSSNTEPGQLSGVYHACGDGETTWFGFAQEFLALAAAKEPGQKWAKLRPIRTEDYPTAARRPMNSRLNCEKLAEKLKFKMPEWQESLRAVMHPL